MTFNWPNEPTFGHDSVLGPIPCMWWGTVDRDGTADPWKLVPAGSIYLYQNSATPIYYVKDNVNNDDDDWGVLAFTT